MRKRKGHAGLSYMELYDVRINLDMLVSIKLEKGVLP
jgi:hypothetical protein